MILTEDMADCKWWSNLQSLSNCVIGVDCSWRSAVLITVTTSNRADLWGLQGLSNITINPTSVSYFLLSPDLQNL